MSERSEFEKAMDSERAAREKAERERDQARGERDKAFLGVAERMVRIKRLEGALREIDRFIDHAYNRKGGPSEDAITVQAITAHARAALSPTEGEGGTENERSSGDGDSAAPRFGHGPSLAPDPPTEAVSDTGTNSRMATGEEKGG